VYVALRTALVMLTSAGKQQWRVDNLVVSGTQLVLG
jgi:hypothetical protein